MSWLKKKDGAPRASSPKPGAVQSVRSVNYSSSPLLASRTPPWRSKFLVALVGAGFCILIGRAVYVQIVDTQFFQRQGEIRYGRTLVLPASRGRILDRNGMILAASLPSPSVWAIPKDFEADDGQKKALAKLLNMTSKDLDAKLEENPNFVWLRRQLDDQVAKDVLALKLKGVHEVGEYRRKYPEGESAAHVVGFTNVEDNGQEGIELAFQKDLAGRDGQRRVIKDRLGRIVDDIGESVAPVDGKDIQLSIDSKVQFFAYQRIRDAVAQHKAKAGSVVVLDAQSGEILALANYPSYTPGDRSKLTGEQLRNRAITDTFEPGSTMKPFTASMVLEAGKVTPSTVLMTSPGRLTITGKTITDSHAHGNLTVAETIQKSSNVGAVRLAQMMPMKDMYDVFTSAGFGQKPQIAFPGAATGRLRPWKSWRVIEHATMAYGYGLSASLFQMAHSYTIFAHNGELIPTTIIKAPDALEGRVHGIRVFSTKTVDEMLGMLRMAAGPGGTGPLAQTMGFSVGGKSGTANKQEAKGYAEHKYRAWFVGIAPITNPRIIVAVLVDEPNNGQHFGGDVAAPVFSSVVQQSLRTMGIAPDIDVKPQIVSNNIPAEVESY